MIKKAIDQTRKEHQVATYNLMNVLYYIFIIFLFFFCRNFLVFIAEELGIKPFIPAYRDPNLKPEDLLTGVTFASGGAGYVPLTTQIAVASLNFV